VAYSKLIAGLMGPLLAAIGIAMLLNRELFLRMATQVAQDTGLLLLSGVLLLVAGVAIVRVHNVWSGGWRVLVTVLGWLAVVSGLVRMWFPWLAVPATEAITAGRVSPAALIVGGLVPLALGAFLTYKAYGPES
jgi:hypothetical protein